MGEPGIAPGGASRRLDSESSLKTLAGDYARRWLALGPEPLVVGLRGDLGSGKTTWVRGMLEGLGYTGRVPSPTYTLVEIYPLDAVTVVHVDLYRLAAADEAGNAAELESLALRDWLAKPATWLLVEWPERAPGLASRCDLTIDFETEGDTRRIIRLDAASEQGESALKSISEES